MATVKLLVRGYVRSEAGVEHASCAVTYIEENGVRVVVDPGMDRKALAQGLASAGVEAGNIDFVVVTHAHLDHVMLISEFKKAKVLDDSAIYTFTGDIYPHDGKVPGTDIRIISTPGHDPSHCSVVADTDDRGTVVIAGDVFWWADDEARESDAAGMIAHADKYAKDEKQLRESRRRILDIADYIIPGHGEAFSTDKR